MVETKHYNMTEEDKKRKRQELKSMDIELISLQIQKDQFEQVIKNDLPMKKARVELMRVMQMIESVEKRIKTTNKLIREGKYPEPQEQTGIPEESPTQIVE